MAAKEKSLWVQVMEAGFGATLEAHGFRRVSPRLYRLEGDGLYWEQFTYRGFKEYPNCIREGHGVVVAGSKEIYRKAFGDDPREFGRYPIRQHCGGRHYDLYGTIRETHDWKHSEERSARRPKTRLGKIWRAFFPDRPVWLENEIKYCAYYHKVDGDSWHLFDLTVEDLADMMIRYWVEYVWEWYISKRLTVLDLAELDFSNGFSSPAHSLNWALYNHLAGRHEKSRYYLANIIRQGEMTIADFRKKLEASPPPALLEYSEGDPEREIRLLEICELHKRRRDKEAMWARRLAAAIDLKM